MARIVIALGGNALGNNPQEQREKTDAAAKSLIALINDITTDNEIIISHGNGPQVGMIDLAFDTASQNPKVAKMPLPECSAMSQGYIGFHLQNSLQNELRRQKLPYHVATVVTQVLVDKNDPAFQNPTKPIGAFYDEETAKQLQKEYPDAVFKEDAGRGYRRMVASPKPIDIVEKASIRTLLNVEDIVIACGGGGIPVVLENDQYQPIPCVIDKDFASAKLAETVEADYLFILTAVDRVAINYGKPDEKELTEITLAEAEQYCREGHFAPGSMLPKVEAAMSFVKGKAGRRAVIASLEKASFVIKGESGTLIKNE